MTVYRQFGVGPIHAVMMSRHPTPEATMTDTSPRSRTHRSRRSLREIFARAARHHRIERRSLPERDRPPANPDQPSEGAP